MRSAVVINGRFLTHKVTGVQRFAHEMIRHMDALRLEEKAFRQLDVVCLAPPGEYDLPEWRTIPVLRRGRSRGNFWEQVELPLLAKGSLLFSPANSGPWQVRDQSILFHDAAVFRRPESYSAAFRLKYHLVYSRLSKVARSVLTSSQFSRRELAHVLHVPEQRFLLISGGSDHLDAVEPDTDILDRLHLQKNAFLLTVASLSSHKNLGNAMAAYRQTGASVKWVLAGGKSEGVFLTPNLPKTDDRVVATGYINDRELKALYENSLGLIQPSTYEGFGLTVLEAFRTGCPVLCSRAGSLPEIAGDAAQYFDPFDVQDMAARIDAFVSDSSLRGQMRSAGIRRAEDFKWSATAEKVLVHLYDVSRSDTVGTGIAV